MGAHNEERRFEDAPQQELIEKWNRLIESDLWENGHDAYSGGIGTMGKGIAKFHDLKLASEREARDFLLDKHQKWSPAHAVSFTEGDRKLWLIGGWAAE